MGVPYFLESLTQNDSKTQTFKRQLIVFLIVISLYLFNEMITMSKDTYANSILPFSILLHHDIFLERYLTHVDLSSAYYVRPYNGHFISTYPIGPALTALPIYLVYLLFGGYASLTTGLIVGKIASAVIATTSVLLLYKLLKNIGIVRGFNILFTILYAFGTETFSVGSQALWEHGSAELWIILFLLGAQKIIIEQPKSVFVSYASGFALGMLLLSRPQDIVISIPFFLLLMINSKRKYALHALPIFMLFILFNFWYNMHYYTEPTLRGGPAQVAHILSAPFIVGLAGNLISPSRGLFIFIPWAILSFAWLPSLFKRQFYSTIYAPILISLTLYIIMYSKLGYWAAGFSFGPRYMTDVSPLIAVLAAGFWNQWTNYRNWTIYARNIVLSIFVVWSLFVQILGTYVLGFSWNLAALPDTFSAPLWTVRYSEIPYYFNTLASTLRPTPSLKHPKAKFLSVQLLEKPSFHTPGISPKVFQPNTQYSGIASVQNIGTGKWSPYLSDEGRNSVFFSYSIWSKGKLIKTSIDSGALLHPVNPGQNINIYFYFRTPSEAGKYTYVFTLTRGSSHTFQTHLSSQNAGIQTITVVPPKS